MKSGQFLSHIPPLSWPHWVRSVGQVFGDLASSFITLGKHGGRKYGWPTIWLTINLLEKLHLYIYDEENDLCCAVSVHGASQGTQIYDRSLLQGDSNLSFDKGDPDVPSLWREARCIQG